VIANLVPVTRHPLAERPSSSAVARSPVAECLPSSTPLPHLLPVLAHLLPVLCDSLASSAPSLAVFRRLLRLRRPSLPVIADLVRIAPTPTP
jgi:hypothetical protein